MRIRKAFVKIIASFFYLGYLPLIPGTFGSLAAIPLYYLIKDSISAYLLFTLLIVILGFLVSGRAEKAMGKKDARQIVIDEVGGMLLSLLFIPYSFKILVVGFFVFRLMDTLKPYPAGRIQHLKGSKGVMLDDIVAAIYTNIILHVFLRFASFRAS